MAGEANRKQDSVAETLAALVTIVLTILGLAHLAPEFLVAIAVIALGAALILSSSSALRLHLLKLSLTTADQRRRAGDTLAAEMLSSSAGIFGLAGLSAIVLGIPALAGFNPVVLVLIALLTLGSVNAVNGIDPTDTMVSAYRRS